MPSDQYSVHDILFNAGLTEAEIANYTADRLMIENYLKPTANVLEIGSRPSVSVFIELIRAHNAKHIVVDNDVGDRDRLNELIELNGMELKVMPIEEFVDIYSYDAVIIEESEGDTAELLNDLPLDKIGIIITSEMGKNRKSRAEVESSLVSQGFEKTASTEESTLEGEQRTVDVYEKPDNEPIVEETVLDKEQIVADTEPPVTHESASEPVAEDISVVASPHAKEEVTIEVTAREQETIAPQHTPQDTPSSPHPLRSQAHVQRRFVGWRRPLMRMGI